MPKPIGIAGGRTILLASQRAPQAGKRMCPSPPPAHSSCRRGLCLCLILSILSIHVLSRGNGTWMDRMGRMEGEEVSGSFGFVARGCVGEVCRKGRQCKFQISEFQSREGWYCTLRGHSVEGTERGGGVGTAVTAALPCPWRPGRGDRHYHRADIPVRKASQRPAAGTSVFPATVGPTGGRGLLGSAPHEQSLP